MNKYLALSDHLVIYPIPFVCIVIMYKIILLYSSTLYIGESKV